MRIQPTVYVLDEDEATRDTIHHMAGTMGLPCRGYSSADDFFESLDGERCGCVIAEFRISGVNGLHLPQRLATFGAPLPVIYLSGNATLPIAVRAMRAGAFHVLEKPPHEQELWDTIQEAITLDRDRFATVSNENGMRQRLASISLREEQVLRLLAEGKQNRTIAKELDLSIRTIEMRRNALVKKLDLRSQDDLVRFAMATYLDPSRPEHPGVHFMRVPANRAWLTRASV